MIIFDDMIADMLSNEKLHLIITELSIRGRNLGISLVFIKQSYFPVLKNIRAQKNDKNKKNVYIEHQHQENILYHFVHYSFF